jgi:signal transduction histidine kinase
MAARKDGSEFPIEVSLSHTKINGEFKVVSFVIDISTRKQMQEKLRKSEAQLITYAAELENQVKRRTEDLNRIVTRLEETNIQLQREISERQKAEQAAVAALQKERELNELKTRFVSSASHEFRTPLSSIMSSASLISKYLEVSTPEKAQKHVKKIKSSVKNLIDILNDFLSLGRLEEGKVELEISRIELHDFIQEVVSDVEGILKTNQRVEVLTPEVPLILECDEKLLRNIIINLTSNASKYSSDDDIIVISATKEGEMVRLSVTDQGIGIPEEEYHHLFKRFFRARNATNIQGTGLGLNIVKKYVELLDGEITFESILNQGTTFHVTVPQIKATKK